LSGVLKSRYGIRGFHPSDYLNAYRKHTFRAFLKKYLSVTAPVFHILEELSQCKAFDAYICGSDQIWNVELTGGLLDPAYFLSFAPKTVPRVAYAASTGNHEISDEVRAKQYLKNLTHVSVREKGLAEPVKRLSGKAPASSMLISG
jgi:hypothetical protein